MPLFFSLGALIGVLKIGATFLRGILRDKDAQHDKLTGALLAMLAANETEGANRERELREALDRVAASNLTRATAHTRLSDQVGDALRKVEARL